MIYYAQTYVKTTSTTLHPVNYVALALNGLFAVLHLFQTHTFYDGLAQDTPEITALGGVALMLIWVLLMENNTRGMVAGKPLAALHQFDPFCEEVPRLLFFLGHHL